MLFEKLSKNISDMPGVEGLCLLDSASELLYSRMPSFIPEESFAEARRRVLALYETLDENFIPADDYLLRFSGHSLLLRRVNDIILLLLTNESANMMSLRMVTNMVLKQVQTCPDVLVELRAAKTKAPPAEKAPAANPPHAPGSPPLAQTAPALATAEAPTTTDTTTAPRKHVRYYRGQPIID